MTLESSGRYVECDKEKGKQRILDRGSTVMLSGEEDDDDEEDQG